VGRRRASGSAQTLRSEPAFAEDLLLEQMVELSNWGKEATTSRTGKGAAFPAGLLVSDLFGEWADRDP
jgi:hypothetical protein